MNLELSRPPRGQKKVKWKTYSATTGKITSVFEDDEWWRGLLMYCPKCSGGLTPYANVGNFICSRAAGGCGFIVTAGRIQNCKPGWLEEIEKVLPPNKQVPQNILVKHGEGIFTCMLIGIFGFMIAALIWC